MADFEVHIIGMEELEKKILAENLLGPALREMLNEAADFTNRQARQFTPVDTGRLASMWATKISPDPVPLWAEVSNLVEYARHVEYGTRPHWAPFRAFQGWAKRHGANEAAVWWAVGLRGTRPFQMLYKASLVLAKQADLIVANAARIIEETFGK